METKTLILDLDGPLLDGRLRHYRCYTSILEAHGYAPVDEETYWRDKRRRVSRRDLLAMSGAETLYPLFLQEWLEKIEQPQFLALDRLQPDVIETLEPWCAEGYRLLLATLRQNPDGLRAQLADLKLDGLFTQVIVCADAPDGESKARRVREALGSVDPTKCLWIGDTEVDIAAGRALGCPVYAVTCGLREQDYLAGLRPDGLFPGIAGCRRALIGVAS